MTGKIKNDMKKIYLNFLPLVLVGGMVLVSCNKEDDIKKDDPLKTYPTEFTKKSSEENKAQLENNGIEMINNMTDLKNSSGIETCKAFAHFLSQDSEDNSNQRIIQNKGIMLLKTLASFGKGQTSATKVFSNMRTAEMGESLQESFDLNKGVYSWNRSTNSWDIDNTGEKIVFQFPSDSTGTSNNATFSIFNYKGVNISNPEMLDNSDYTGDYPETLNAELVVDGKKQMEYSFAAKYNSNGEPTSVTTSLALSPFTLTVSASNTTTLVKADYSLKRAEKVLVAFGAEANGNFKSSNIVDAEVGDVVETSKSYFQILNIRLTGEANVKVLQPAIDNAATVEEEVEIINDNYKLIVSYADSNEKIADTEFYVNEDSDASIRFIFADGSKADPATYFGEGFEDIEDKFTNFSNDVEDDF